MERIVWLFCAWMKTCPDIALKERNSELMLHTSNTPRLHARLQLAQAFVSTTHVCFLWLLPRLERTMHDKTIRCSNGLVFGLKKTCVSVASFRKEFAAQSMSMCKP
jgi:hypothetical protein